MILRYEDEVRALIAESTERALEVRHLRVVNKVLPTAYLLALAGVTVLDATYR